MRSLYVCGAVAIVLFTNYARVLILGFLVGVYLIYSMLRNMYTEYLDAPIHVDIPPQI